jgi:hypothetical protein
MRYWLLRRPPHYTEIQPSLANTPWDYDMVSVDVQLKAGDVVYLTAAGDELYGWGHVVKRESYREPETQQRVYRVTVTRPVVRPNLVSAAAIKNIPELRELFVDSNRNLVLMKANQINLFNGLLRSAGVVAPADLNSDKPEPERSPKESFPRLSLNPETTAWLTAAYEQLRQGKKLEPTEMLVELWSSLPEDFDYNQIDSRVMRFGVELTLLGILHIDPATELVDQTDQVIRFVRELIKKEPAIGAITSEQVSEELIIPEANVAVIFALMSHLGDFWNGGAGYGDKPGYYSVTIRDEKVKREYLRYKDIDSLLERLGGMNSSRQSQVQAPVTVNGSEADQIDVSLSFAGQDRPYVDQVAAALNSAGVKVFYDRYEQVSLWGKDLYQHLDEVYRKRARYCVIFISKSYADRLWTRHELKSAQARAFEENREYILPVRLDQTELPGVLPTIGYVSDISPEDLANLIIKKVQEPETSRQPSLEIIEPAAAIKLRDGSTATSDQQADFFGVWRSLLLLEKAGQALWEQVSGERLAVFADRQRDAQQSIDQQALFFSEEDYNALQEIMKAADFYLNGKTKLSNIYDGKVETQGVDLAIPGQSDMFMDREVRAQIQQNKRWLTRYRNILRAIRARLHARVTNG